MSIFNMGKKFKPATKAWKSMTKALLNLSQAVKRTTHRLHFIRRYVHLRHHRQCPRHNRTSCPKGKGSGTIYVDQLFGRHVPLQVNRQVTSRKGTTSSASDVTDIGVKSFNLKIKSPEMIDSRMVKSSETNPKTLADAWNNMSISSLPRLHGNIDEKAEEFISKFRNDIKLQKEKSFLDFQEMLARSS